MDTRLTLKSVSVAFPDTNTIELTGDAKLKKNVSKFLNSAGYDFKLHNMSILGEPGHAENTTGFRCIVTFGEDDIREINDFKREWFAAVAANESGCENNCIMEGTGTLDYAEKSGNFCVELLACGRLEVSMIDDSCGIHRYSEPLDDVINNMSLSTVKYLANILNATLAAQDKT